MKASGKRFLEGTDPIMTANCTVGDELLLTDKENMAKAVAVKYLQFAQVTCYQSEVCTIMTAQPIDLGVLQTKVMVEYS